MKPRISEIRVKQIFVKQGVDILPHSSDHTPDWKLLGYAVEMHSNCVNFFAPLKSQYIKGKDLNSIMQYVEN